MGRNWRQKNQKDFLFSNPILLFDRRTSDFHWCKDMQEQSLGYSFHLITSTIRNHSHITLYFLSSWTIPGRVYAIHTVQLEICHLNNGESNLPFKHLPSFWNKNS